MSQIYLTLHIWKNKNNRMASTEQIFSAFSYDGLIIDQSLALSRWRTDPLDEQACVEVKKTRVENLNILVAVSRSYRIKVSQM